MSKLILFLTFCLLTGCEEKAQLPYNLWVAQEEPTVILDNSHPYIPMLGRGVKYGTPVGNGLYISTTGKLEYGIKLH